MNTKHTPGPWLASQSAARFAVPGVHDAAQDAINARLIAAAPELADASRRALDVMERSYLNPESVDLQELLAVIEIQRAALAKAGL